MSDLANLLHTQAAMLEAPLCCGAVPGTDLIRSHAERLRELAAAVAEMETNAARLSRAFASAVADAQDEGFVIPLRPGQVAPAVGAQS